jgi:hypothetical protein
MRKAVVVFLLASLLAPLARADDGTLLSLNQARLSLDRSGMLALGSFSVASVGLGLGLGLAGPAQQRPFWLTNAAWGAVDLIIAGVGYYSATHSDPASFTLAQTEAQQRSALTTYGINVGLDVAYAVAGGWIWEKGTRSETPTLRGVGQAVLLQGAALLVLDTVMLLLHSSYSGKIDALIR